MSEQPQATTRAEFDRLVSALQAKVIVPRERRAAFGGRDGCGYRNAEDIMAQVQTHKGQLVVTTSDSYDPATGVMTCRAALTYDGHELACLGYGQVDPAGKMSPSQRIGAASSYGRKYALAGLLGLHNEKGLELEPDDDGLGEESGKQRGSSYSNAPQGQAVKQVQAPKPPLVSLSATKQPANPVKQSSVVQPEPPPNLGGDQPVRHETWDQLLNKKE